MKKSILSLILILGTIATFAQCVPDFTFTTPGFKPYTTALPCVEQGTTYNQVITLRNFTAVTGYSVDSLVFDSISNLPCGLKYAFNKRSQSYVGGETGCLLIYGTTSDPVGQYKLGMYAKVYGTPDLPAPLEGSSQRLDLIAPLGGYDFRYFIRVNAPATTCAALDTTASFSGNKFSSCKAQNTTDVNSVEKEEAFVFAYPTPANDQFFIQIASQFDEVVLVKMISTEGKEVLNVQKEILTGENKASLNIQDLPSGMYHLIVSSSHIHYTTKFIKN